MNRTISKNCDESSIPDQTGKTVLVTGGNIGLGYETARMLAGKGARLLMACRNAASGTEALKAIRAIHDEAKLDLYPLDLADLESVASSIEASPGSDWAQPSRLLAK
ncbi:MAG: SDR family NAD(P)-dependent oxidoreductase [Pseudomonadota bacterium]